MVFTIKYGVFLKKNPVNQSNEKLAENEAFMKNMMKHMDTKPWHRDIKPYKTNKLYEVTQNPR